MSWAETTRPAIFNVGTQFPQSTAATRVQHTRSAIDPRTWDGLITARNGIARARWQSAYAMPLPQAHVTPNSFEHLCARPRATTYKPYVSATTAIRTGDPRWKHLCQYRGMASSTPE